TTRSPPCGPGPRRWGSTCGPPPSWWRSSGWPPPTRPGGCSPDGRAAVTAVARAFALDHLVLVVADVERTVGWYQRFAGLAPVRFDEWRRGEVPFPSLRVDEAMIIDVIPGRPEGSAERGHLDHVC